MAVAVWFKEPNLAIFKIREQFVVLLWVKFTCPDDPRLVNIGVVENILPEGMVGRSIAHDDQVLARYLVQLPLAAGPGVPVPSFQAFQEKEYAWSGVRINW